MKNFYVLIGSTMFCSMVCIQANNHDARTSELFSAIETGNEAKVIQLMSDGVSPDAELNGLSALMQAIELYNTPMVRLLLKLGADPNKIAGNNMTPYTYSLSRDLEYYSILGTQGGNINAVDGLGKRGIDYIFQHHNEREIEDAKRKKLENELNEIKNKLDHFKLIRKFEQGLIKKEPEEEWININIGRE